MIITLTPNTGIDHTIRVSSFQLNSTLRAIDSAWGMGGKATDVSWILGKLGIPNRALGFAAGENGSRMERMLQERGVETDFVWVEGETRLNTVLVVSGQGQSTITTSSLRVAPEHVSELTARFQKALQGASCLVMGGSLPAGVPLDFYPQAIAQARDAGVPVIFDSSGAGLEAGLKSRPDLIKPNQAEMADLVGYVPASRQEALDAAKSLRDRFGSSVLVTLGSDGAIAVLPEGAYFVEPVSVPVVSSAGAGDGVLAGMALAYERGESLLDGLRYGFALATAILETLATADFVLETYQTLLPQIRIAPLAEQR